MRDPEIRAALVARLRRSHPDPVENRICSEMAVGLGASRVDVGMVNGRVSGFEIKSAYDNLDRLPDQVLHYGRCLDNATIVTTEGRRNAVADHVPAWWGVMVAYNTNGGVVLKERRRGRRNPDLDPFYVAQLLWRDEAYAELQARDLHHGLRKATRWQLWDRLAELPLDELRGSVRRRLKSRPPI